MEDIGKELLEKIQAEFSSRVENDSVIKGILERIENGTSVLGDTAVYSKRLGYHLAHSIQSYVTQENLPNGKLYYNIAQTILEPTLYNNYELVNETASAVQKVIDRENNINIKAQKAEYPQERVQQIVNAASDTTADWSTIQRRLDVPVQTVTESFHDDYVKANADFRSKAGLEVFIIRTDHSGCCDWCRSLAGKYRYPDEVPEDVYRRHDNCGCTVTFESGKSRQDVWSKRTWEVSEEEIETRKSVDNQLVKYTPEQAKKLEKEVAERVDKSGKSDIIEVDKQSLSKYIGENITETDNQHVREWYYANVNDIPNKIDKTKSFEDQAKQAFELRNKYKREARAAMADEDTAKLLDKKRPVLTFEELLESKINRKGMSREEALKDILETASKTNDDVNSKFGL